jgi:hypothetical protein
MDETTAITTPEQPLPPDVMEKSSSAATSLSSTRRNVRTIMRPSAAA